MTGKERIHQKTDKGYDHITPCGTWFGAANEWRL